MRGSTPINPYEVNCARCRVSFPVGTRVCIHCGQPIERPGAERVGVPRSTASDEETFQEVPLRALKASPFTLVWLAAGLATVAYRACS
jgi:hypothetical protein